MQTTFTLVVNNAVVRLLIFKNLLAQQVHRLSPVGAGSFLILYLYYTTTTSECQEFIQYKLLSSSFLARATCLRKSLTRVRAASSLFSLFLRDGLA